MNFWVSLVRSRWLAWKTWHGEQRQRKIFAPWRNFYIAPAAHSGLAMQKLSWNSPKTEVHIYQIIVCTIVHRQGKYVESLIFLCAFPSLLLKPEIAWYCMVLQGNSGKFQGIVIYFIILTHIETRDLHSLINFEQLSLNSTSYHILCYHIIIILYYILSYHLLSYHMLLNEYSPFQLVNYVSCF